MREVGLLLNTKNLPLFWHEPNLRTEVALPDSFQLWETIWNNRFNISGFAHTHPGSKTPYPSTEDLTTFSAVEIGIGRRLDWWIINEKCTVLYRWTGPDKYQYSASIPDFEPGWVGELRERSEILTDNL